MNFSAIELVNRIGTIALAITTTSLVDALSGTAFKFMCLAGV
jgi:hypothetical protein